MEATATRAGAPASSNGHGDPDDVPEPTTPDDEVKLEGEDDDDEAAVLPEMKLDLGNEITLTVGGKKPTGSVVVLRGGRIPLEGQMKKGELIDLRLRVRCVDIQFPDKIDSKTGEVTETNRVHVVKATQIQRLPSEPSEEE